MSKIQTIGSIMGIAPWGFMVFLNPYLGLVGIGVQLIGLGILLGVAFS